jgi:hypothetical protein
MGHGITKSGLQYWGDAPMSLLNVGWAERVKVTPGIAMKGFNPPMHSIAGGEINTHTRGTADVENAEGGEQHQM